MRASLSRAVAATVSPPASAIADLISGAGTEVREIRSIAELEVDAEMVKHERSHHDGIHVYCYFGPTLPIVVSFRGWPLADADKPDANESGD